MSLGVATSRLQCPVVIVGGGPVGLTLALFLDVYGVQSVVFNSEDDTRMYPKGSTENCRTMEHFRRLGLMPALRGVGMPENHPTDVAYFTRFNGWELARIRMPSERDARDLVRASVPTDQTPEPMFRANQVFIDRFLLRHAMTRANITLRFGWAVTGIEERADGVAVRAADSQSGTEERWQAMFVAGCDGAQGIVRRSLGIGYSGHENLQQAFHGGRMISTHVRAPALDEILSRRKAWQYWALNPEVRSVLLSVNGREEFALFSRPRDDEPLPDAAAVQRVIQRSAGVEVPVEVIAQSPWNSGVARVADRFGTRRVFLAGDSAHLFTPTGGFGMNTGIDDAANLSWKLAAVVKGWGGSELLASYEIERKPIAVRNTTAARELAKRIGGLNIPAEIEAESPDGERARAALGSFLAGNAPQFGSLGVQLGARYDGSPIIVADGEPPLDAIVEYTPSAVPGGRAPHFWLTRGREIGDSVFDRRGLGFTLLVFRGRGPEADGLLAAAAERSLPLVRLDISEAYARDLYERDFVLIRPDCHVAWRGDHPPSDAGWLLDRLAGRVPKTMGGKHGLREIAAP